MDVTEADGSVSSWMRSDQFSWFDLVVDDDDSRIVSLKYGTEDLTHYLAIIIRVYNCLIKIE